MRNVFLVHIAFAAFAASAQTVERKRPAGWDRLVPGGRFMDRFEAASPTGDGFTDKCWGGDNVKPRDVRNGIEDQEYSYWGGNIVSVCPSKVCFRRGRGLSPRARRLAAA